jgi:hypothetical protein
MVTYTGVSSAVETNNWDGGLYALTMQVNQVPKLTADSWFKDLGAWRAEQLWRVGGNGTIEATIRRRAIYPNHGERSTSGDGKLCGKELLQSCSTKLLHATSSAVQRLRKNSMDG